VFHWLPVSEIDLVIALLVTAVASTLQATIGFGFGILSVPILYYVNPKLAPVPQLLLIAPLALSMVWRERKSLDLSGLGWVILGRVIGAGLGVALLNSASQFVLDISIAAVVLLAVTALTLIDTVPRNRTTELLAGTASGTGALVSSIGGPPLALLYRDSGGGALRSSLAVIFVLGLVITMSARIAGGLITQDDLIIGACLLPAIAFGLLLSRFLIGRIEGAPLRKAIIIVATLSAVTLGYKAFNQPISKEPPSHSVNDSPQH
jgi:uncharacterized membrane protein YfcA